MNRNSFRALLQDHKSDLWCERTIADSDKKCRVIPIFSITCYGHIQHDYGVVDQGYWVKDMPTIEAVSATGKYIGFLPILDFHRAEIIEKIREGITRASLPQPVLRTFPFDPIIRGAFSHWKVSVERWINEGYPLDETLCSIYEDNKKVIEFRHHRESKIFEAQQGGI